MKPPDLDPVIVLGTCAYEVGGLAGLWKPLTHIFRERPWAFAVFVGWLVWHTWFRSGAPFEWGPPS